jgi:hypothetical protein
MPATLYGLQAKEGQRYSRFAAVTMPVVALSLRKQYHFAEGKYRFYNKCWGFD